MTNSRTAHYSFGDEGPASERLRRLAELYRPASAALLARARDQFPAPISLAIDLGAGPGHTTALVAEVTNAARTIGFERSPAFCEEARGRAGTGVEVIEHDVSAAALPCSAAELAFCRFLLTHLPQPVTALKNWRGAVRPGGLLVLEELERLRSSDPVLSRYYELIEGLQEHHGQRMYIGAHLEEFLQEAGFEIASSQILQAGISAASMASLHRRNLENVRKDSWAKERFGEADLDELAAGLGEIEAETDNRTPIDNALRQIIARRPY